jgi:hypothetical protein
MSSLDKDVRYATHRRWRERNKESVKVRSKAYRVANREKINEYKRRWRVNNNRANDLMYKFRVTPEWYETTLKNQGGMCAYPLCEKTEESEGRKLAVDHDHITNKPRAILCFNHNTKIGDLEFHLWAVKYITQHRLEN